MGIFSPKWRRKFNLVSSILTILLASICSGFYIYWLVTDQYLHTWYFKIGVGVACIGALSAAIAHEIDYYKNKKK